MWLWLWLGLLRPIASQVSATYAHCSFVLPTAGQKLTRERLFKTMMEYRVRDEINAREEGMEDM